MLWLFEHIIDSSVVADSDSDATGGQIELFSKSSVLRGLPIGNLTSQFLANLYLNELDQFIKHTLRCRHYIRYMDDFVLFCNDRNQLQEWRSRVYERVNRGLLLELHEKGGIKEYREGLSFLGFRVFRTHRLLKGVALTRFLRRARRRWVELDNVWGDEQVRRCKESIAVGTKAWLAHLKYGDTHGLVLRLQTRYPMLNVG